MIAEECNAWAATGHCPGLAGDRPGFAVSTSMTTKSAWVPLLSALASCGPAAHELPGQSAREASPPRIIRGVREGEAERTDVATGRTFAAGKADSALAVRGDVRDKRWSGSTDVQVRTGQAAGQAADQASGSLWAGQDTTGFFERTVCDSWEGSPETASLFKAAGSACPSSKRK
jgi:hypothetical protein